MTSLFPSPGTVAEFVAAVVVITAGSPCVSNASTFGSKPGTVSPTSEFCLASSATLLEDGFKGFQRPNPPDLVAAFFAFSVFHLFPSS